MTVGVGEMLRELRGDMTLRFVAKRARLSFSHVSDIERGRRLPSRDAVDALLGVYASTHQRKPITALIERAVAAQLLSEWRRR